MNAPEHRRPSGSAPIIGEAPTKVTAVGSRVTCNPPPETTDRDWLVLVDLNKFDFFAAELLADGWEVGGSMVPTDDNYLPESQRFNSFTKTIDGTPENLIVTSSVDFHRRFLAASAVAKRLNLMHKPDRVALFQAVLYGATTDDAFSDALSEYVSINIFADLEPAF